MFSSLPLYNHQREVGEAPRGHHRRVARVELCRRTYVLEVVVRVLWMQGHAAVHFVGALRQLHDDHRSAVVHQPFQLLCGRRAGQHREPLFLAGCVQSCQGSRSNEGRDARHVFRRPSVGPQPLEDVVDGRVEARVARTMFAAREVRSPLRPSVSGQNTMSAACRAFQPFRVMSSGSPGPREMNRMG